MSRLRVALVANNIHFRGGMERSCAELAAALSLRHDVHLFASEIADVPFERLTVHPVPTVKRPALALWAQFYLRSSRKIDRREFDIVHTVGGITAHQNVVTAQFCQYAWGETLRREAGAATGITPYHHLVWRLTGRLEKRAMVSPETRVIGANSCRTRGDLTRWYGCDPAKIAVIYNGVDTARFSPDTRRFRDGVRRRCGISSDALLLLFVGEYGRKGLAAVLRALGRLGNRQAHLLAVGQGNRAQFQALAERLGVSRQVTLAGPTSPIEQVFGAADVFVFPTWYEPFGLVITEAMASGLPVVTTRRAGAAELIEDGISGVLIGSPGDEARLSAALEPLLADAARREAMGEAARAAVQGCSWQAVAEATERLYARALAG